jgi:sterol desaturase/sphingolipid hydroxylase (fatty acid hydroxylase superfamily)
MADIQVQDGELSGPLRGAIRRSLVLLGVVCPLLVACWQLSENRPLGELTLGIYVAVAGLLMLCEHFLAFRGDWGSVFRGSKTDFLYVILGAALERVSFLACVTLVASLGLQLSSYLQIDLWPSGWALGFQVVAALLIADMGAYFRHRLFHRSSMLWRFHQIHHSPTGLFWIRSAHTHPVEQLCIMLAIMLPIALLGASAELIALVAFVYGLSGLLQHSNIDARSSILNFVFATPEVHRIHHRADERGNRSNFSAFFVVMDILFGTYCRPTPAEDPERVGLGGVTAFPKDFLSHLVLPFKRDQGEFVADNASGTWPREASGASES